MTAYIAVGAAALEAVIGGTEELVTCMKPGAIVYHSGYGPAPFDSDTYRPPRISKEGLIANRDIRMSTRLDRRRKALNKRRINEWKWVLGCLFGFPVVMTGLAGLYKGMLWVILG